MNDHSATQLASYKRLIEISRDLASTLDLDTLLRRIILAAKEISISEAASILLYDEKKQELFFAAATNASSEMILRGISVPMESVAGWVALNRQYAIVDDVHKDERYFDHVEKATQLSTRSLVAIPMITKEHVIGVLEVLNKTEGSFSMEDIEILIVLGAQAAIAIENTRLFQQSDLISELVHELRTPLTSIGTIAYLLERPNTTEEQRVDLAHTIHQETQRLNEMASRFLDLSRLESGRANFEMSTFPVADLIDEACQIIQAKATDEHIQIHLEVLPTVSVIEADRDKIKQVLINLLSNAVKYNKPGGDIYLKTWDDGNSLYISVRDTGIGVPEDALPHLFEKFFRHSAAERTAHGTGLGLSICRKIVENHNGQISVASQVGEGTIFTIQLPLQINLA